MEVWRLAIGVATWRDGGRAKEAVRVETSEHGGMEVWRCDASV